ncbi:murein biosynthesis integral membrane protein MurJ [Candidatus Gromoviella agglomerans]|uniref:murein biosynthesis integral membrane protein MurJ n=1 Tax=Candidatus Gromoviella agglomerans TaxID=2806609 RepID=UPI001E5E43A7|nr:murein biosynthesis integral membrane protein MurJ [Candidatus Gromoviella agglomerans]UFX98207.1 Lipid II flippase MurJ [Candidatus Gromoviella agglomerans]
MKNKSTKYETAAYSFFTTSLWTFLSRIGGFIRESILANLLGASAITDLLFLSLRLPSLFRRIFAEGAMSNSFIPIFSNLYSKNSLNGMEFARKAFISITALIILFIILFQAFIPNICNILFSGISDSSKILLIELYRITILFLLVSFMTDFYGSILNSFKRFGPYASSTVFGNIIHILCLLFLGYFNYFNVHWAARLTLVSGTTQFLLVIGCMWYMDIKMKFQYSDFKVFKEILRHNSFKCDELTPSNSIKLFFQKFASSVFSSSISQLDVLVGIYIASFLKVGGVSYLSYADRIFQMPLSFIGVSLGSISLAFLSKKISSESVEEIQKFQNKIFEIAVILSVICAINIHIFSDFITKFVYGWGGKITAENLINISNTLKGYAIGLPFFVVLKIIYTFCFARKDTSLPLKISILSFITSTLASFFGMTKFGHTGISFAIAINATLIAFVFLIYLHRKRYFTFPLKFILKMYFVSAITFFSINLLKLYISQEISLICVCIIVICFLMFVTKIIDRNTIKDLTQLR